MQDLLQAETIPHVVLHSLGRYYVVLIPCVGAVVLAADLAFLPLWEHFVVPSRFVELRDILRSVQKSLAGKTQPQEKMMLQAVTISVDACAHTDSGEDYDVMAIGDTIRKGLRTLYLSNAWYVVKTALTRHAIELTVCAVAHRYGGYQEVFHLWSLKRSFDSHWCQRWVPLPTRFYQITHVGRHIPWDRVIELQGGLTIQQSVLLFVPDIVATEMINAYRWGRKQDPRSPLWYAAFARAAVVPVFRIWLTLTSSTRMEAMARTKGSTMWFFNPARGQSYLSAMAAASMDLKLPK